MDTHTVGASGIPLTPPSRPNLGQSGFSILEVLIAIIILSIGMLGAVGMQAASLRANKESRSQATAATFARELAEKMRGNYTVAIKTTTADNPFLLNTTLYGTVTVATPSVNCFTTGCSDLKNAAAWDVADWQRRVQAALPTPRVRICFDSAPFDAAGLAKWACTDTGDILVLKMGWTRNNTKGELEVAYSANDTVPPVVVLPMTPGILQ